MILCLRGARTSGLGTYVLRLVHVASTAIPNLVAVLKRELLAALFWILGGGNKMYSSRTAPVFRRF